MVVLRHPQEAQEVRYDEHHVLYRKELSIDYKSLGGTRELANTLPGLIESKVRKLTRITT